MSQILQAISSGETRVRRSLQELQKEFDAGNPEPLNNVIRAFKGIQELDPSDLNSFFRIAGYHGEPFRGPGAGGMTLGWWGGFCHHGDILFPVWHRAYLLCLENALRSIDKCDDVTLPFWDECYYVEYIIDVVKKYQAGGTLPEIIETDVIPKVLTTPKWQLDGLTIDNPLYSYALQKSITDATQTVPDYSKAKDYKTVRYPLSGLMGPTDLVATLDHNRNYPDAEQNTWILNANVWNWLIGETKIEKDPVAGGRTPNTSAVYGRFLKCLEAENYNIFSNTQSQAYWIDQAGKDPTKEPDYFDSLESPHNAIHLAVGGFYVGGTYNADEILGANGDMGENDTAAFDPIFFLHHCFIDYVFSLWQKKWNQEETILVLEDYNDPGLSSMGVAGVPQGDMLSMETKLFPFINEKTHQVYKAHEMASIRELGYKYGPGSLDKRVEDPSKIVGQFPMLGAPVTSDVRGLLHISGISRERVSGSFVVETRATNDKGKDILVHREAVLGRWGIQGCQNCQAHLDVNIVVPLHKDVTTFQEGDDKWTYNTTVKNRAYTGVAKPVVKLIKKDGSEESAESATTSLRMMPRAGPSFVSQASGVQREPGKTFGTSVAEKILGL